MSNLGTHHQYPQDMLVEYLLGELSLEATAELEEQFIGDESLFARIELVEDELYDDYASGQLSKHRKDVFQSRFLQTEIGRERLAFALALHGFANAQGSDGASQSIAKGTKQSGKQGGKQEAQSQNQKRNSSWWQRWGRSTILGSTGMLVTVLVVLFVIRPGGNDEHLDTSASIVLVEQGLRSNTSIVLLPNTEQVVLQISVTQMTSVQYSVRILRGDEVLPAPSFSVEEGAMGEGKILVVIQPSELPVGIYELELSIQKAQEAAVVLGYYSFQKGE